MVKHGSRERGPTPTDAESRDVVATDQAAGYEATASGDGVLSLGWGQCRA